MGMKKFIVVFGLLALVGCGESSEAKQPTGPVTKNVAEVSCTENGVTTVYRADADDVTYWDYGVGIIKPYDNDAYMLQFGLAIECSTAYIKEVVQPVSTGNPLR